MAQFRNESDLIASLSVLVDQERLIRIADVLVVPGLVVVLVGDLLEELES